MATKEPSLPLKIYQRVEELKRLRVKTQIRPDFNPNAVPGYDSPNFSSGYALILRGFCHF